jgi:hypothetical protein
VIRVICKRISVLFREEGIKFIRARNIIQINFLPLLERSQESDIDIDRSRSRVIFHSCSHARTRKVAKSSRCVRVFERKLPEYGVERVYRE